MLLILLDFSLNVMTPYFRSEDLVLVYQIPPFHTFPLRPMHKQNGR